MTRGGITLVKRYFNGVSLENCTKDVSGEDLITTSSIFFLLLQNAAERVRRNPVAKVLSTSGGQKYCQQ